MQSHYDTLAAGSYAKAREAFLERVAKLQACRPAPCPVSLSSEPIPGPRGKDGEELFVDILTLGASEATNVLFISNGVHGVEGFAGASVMLELVTRITHGVLTLPPDVRLMMIFAVNPYGMSWHRRTDHENIDVNRNFVDFKQLPPPAAVYRWLTPVLNRPVLSWKNPFGLLSLAVLVVVAMFIKALRLTGLDYRIRRDVSGGQHHDASGIFYGGSKASASREIVIRHLEEQVITADLMRCVWLDFHTGLGPQGALTPILCPSAKHSPALLKNKVRAIYGPGLCDALGEGLSAVERGKINTWCLDLITERAPNVETLGLTLEFGARPMRRTFLTIRQQNLEVGKCTGNAPPKTTKGFDTFFISDQGWLDSLTTQSLTCVEQSLSYLTQRA